MSETIPVPKEEYIQLKKENAHLRKELGYTRDGTISKLLKKLKKTKSQNSKGEIYTLSDINL